jgi:hypothetical protein
MTTLPTPAPTLTPPGYPLRPVNGGPLPKAQPKHGNWYYEPKYNGWRAWVHVPTGTMFNCRLERLSIEREFKAALTAVRVAFVGMDGTGHVFEWLDVEAIERRHNIGRGSLLLLDSPQAGRTYKDRRARLELNCATVGIALFNELNRPLPDNCVRLTMSYRDDGALARVGDFCEAERLTNRGDWHGLWDILQECNRVLGCDFYEGLVAKRADSLYPLQLRSASEEYPYWMKHRWAF